MRLIKTFTPLVAIFIGGMAAAQPVITGFLPTRGIIGSSITINGNNFSTTPGNNIVLFGATKAAVVTATSSSLTVSVPPGATFGRITVTCNGFSTFSSDFFTVISGEVLTPASFISKTDFQTELSPSLLARGDLNDDGRPDMVVSNFGSNSISVFINSSTPGTVAFNPALNLPTGPNPETVQIVDVNSDGKMDIIVSNITNFYSIFINTSIGGILSFANRLDVAWAGINYSPRGIYGTDLDDDGKTDIVTADNNKFIDWNTNHEYGTISISRNTGFLGNISFATPIIYKAGEYPRSVFAADFDGDNKPDLGVTNHVTPSVSLFLNASVPGNINFVAQPSLAIGGRGQQLNIADMDGDGKKDILTSVLFGTGGVHIFRNTSTIGNLSFARPFNILPGGPLDIAVGDLDGDGMPDLAITNVNTGRISVYKNISTPGNLAFGPKMDYTGGAPGHNLIGIGIGDVDGDSFPDLTITNQNTNVATILRMAASIPDPPKVTLRADTSICNGDFVMLTATNTNATYRWSTGETTAQIVVKQAGRYWVEVKNAVGTASDTFELTVKPAPMVFLGNDDLLCKGESKILSALNSGSNYLWNTGATTSDITVTSGGTYSVVVNLNGCMAKDTVVISYDSIPVFSLGPDTYLCTGKQIVLFTPHTLASHIWNNGSVADSLVITSAGTYSLTLTNQCGVGNDVVHIETGDCKVYVPNAFSPNRDNLNDYFKPIVKGQTAIYRFEIYDRWGNIVFRTTDPTKGWDGKANNKSPGSSNFIWQCIYQFVDDVPRQIKGTVMLIK